MSSIPVFMFYFYNLNVDIFHFSSTIDFSFDKHDPFKIPSSLNAFIHKK